MRPYGFRGQVLSANVGTSRQPQVQRGASHGSASLEKGACYPAPRALRQPEVNYSTPSPLTTRSSPTRSQLLNTVPAYSSPRNRKTPGATRPGPRHDDQPGRPPERVGVNHGGARDCEAARRVRPVAMALFREARRSAPHDRCKSLGSDAESDDLPWRVDASGLTPEAAGKGR